MKRNEGSNRRRVFRLRLPDDALLSASINGQTYEVIEIAEFSLVVTAREVESQTDCFGGAIRWSDGTSSEFTGESGRLSQLGRVIWNVKGIQMRDVIGEQRRMISRFPAASPLRKTS